MSHDVGFFSFRSLQSQSESKIVPVYSTKAELHSFLTSACGKFHAPTALPLLPTEQEARWAPEPVWTFGEVQNWLTITRLPS